MISHHFSQGAVCHMNEVINSLAVGGVVVNMWLRTA